MLYEAVVTRKVSLEISDEEIKNCENKALHFMNTMEVAKGILDESSNANGFIEYVRTKYELEIPELDFNKHPSLVLYTLAEVTRCLCTKSNRVIFIDSLVEKFKKNDYTIMKFAKDDDFETFVKCVVPGSEYEIYAILLEEAVCEGKVSLFIPIVKILSEEIVKAVTYML